MLPVIYFEILTLSVLLARWSFGAPYCILHTNMLVSSKIGESRVIFCGESSHLAVDCLLVPERHHGEACMHPHRCPLKSLTGGSYRCAEKLRPSCDPSFDATLVEHGLISRLGLSKTFIHSNPVRFGRRFGESQTSLLCLGLHF